MMKALFYEWFLEHGLGGHGSDGVVGVGHLLDGGGLLLRRARAPHQEGAQTVDINRVKIENWLPGYF